MARSSGAATLRWSELILHLRDIPSVASVTVWPFEGYGDAPSTVFSSMLGPDIAAGLTLVQHTVLQSISAEGVAHLLAWDRKGDMKAKAQEVRQTFHLDQGYSPFRPWSSDVLTASKAAYLEDLDRIAAMDGVTFLKLPFS